MAISYTIYDFPTLGVQSQMFYAGGQAYDGGFTSGGARISSPEPGGRAFLEVQLSLQVREWDAPFVSWLTSKINNGTIFRVKLSETPQLVGRSKISTRSDGIPWSNNQPWSNDENWASRYLIQTTAPSLEGTNKILINRTQERDVLRHGHVIGIGDHSYLVDDISRATQVTLTLDPPLRKDVANGALINLRPNFLGMVSNPSEFRATYERANNGHIQPGRLIFTEVIV